MFAVLIPTFYAGSIHGFWIGLLTFFMMTVLILSVTYFCIWRPDFPDYSSDSSEEEMRTTLIDNAFKRLERYRFWIGLTACVLIALSGMEACNLLEDGSSICERVFWRKA